MQSITAWHSPEASWSWLGLRLVSTRATGSLAPRWSTSAARALTLATGTTQFKRSLVQPGGKWTSQDSPNADVRNFSTSDGKCLFISQWMLGRPRPWGGPSFQPQLDRVNPLQHCDQVSTLQSIQKVNKLAETTKQICNKSVLITKMYIQGVFFNWYPPKKLNM